MQTSEYKDGVYFDLPEEDYHKIPALSASGIKNLLISPVDFWARSWMNPRYNLQEDTEAQITGSAYHKRVLERKDAFYSKYCPEFSGVDLPAKVDELREALRRYGQKTEGNSNDLLARCARFGIKTYPMERAEYMAKNEGKIFLTQDLIESIEISAAMIEKNPKLSRCFSGGYPEVTIIWTEERVINDPEGTEHTVWIRFKARIDYLKTKAIIDLKTFENRAMKAVGRAIYSTMASYKYHIQAVFYLRAVEKAKEFCNHDRFLPSDAHDDQIKVRGSSYPRAEVVKFCEALRQSEDHEFYFVFQQKGIAPFARCFKFPRTTMFGVGTVQIDAAINIYIENYLRFGEEQWIDTSEIEVFEDEGFPVWATSDL